MLVKIRKFYNGNAPRTTHHAPRTTHHAPLLCLLLSCLATAPAYSADWNFEDNNKLAQGEITLATPEGATSFSAGETLGTSNVALTTSNAKGLRAVFLPLAGMTVASPVFAARVLEDGTPQLKSFNSSWFTGVTTIPVTGTVNWAMLTTSGMLAFNNCPSCPGGRAINMYEWSLE